MNILGRLGLGFIIGSGILTLSLFITNWMGVPINLGSLLIIVAIFTALLLVLKRYIPKQIIHKKEPWKRVDYAILTIILLLLTVVVVNGLWNVVSVWDALTLYDFRALRIVETGSIAQVAIIQGDYFYGYPLFTSLAHVALYLVGFKSPMIFYSLLFISFISVFYNLVRRSVSRIFSLLATLLVILAPHLFWHAQIAYTNLPYTIYLGLGTIYILEYSRSGKRTDALLGALLTGLSLWIRSVEPFWMVNIVVLLGIALYKKKYLDGLISLIIFIPLERIWKVYSALAHGAIAENPIRQVSGIVASTVTTAVGVTVSTTPSISVAVIDYFFANAIRPFSPVLLLLIVAIAYKASKWSRDWIGEIMIFAYYAIALYGTYVFSYSQPYWNTIPGSLERMMMFVSPIIIYLFTKTFEQIMSTNKPQIQYNKKIL